MRNVKQDFRRDGNGGYEVGLWSEHLCQWRWKKLPGRKQTALKAAPAVFRELAQEVALEVLESIDRLNTHIAEILGAEFREF